MDDRSFRQLHEGDHAAATGTTGMRRQRSGFTMLEAIVALALVGLVCVGVLAAYGSALRADATAVDRLPLAALAVERIAAVDLHAGSLERLPDSLARGTFSAPYAGTTWTIATRRVTHLHGLFDVTVHVRAANDVFTLGTRRYRSTVAPAYAER